MMTNSRARGDVRPDAPNTNYTINHNTLIVNKRQTIRCVLLQCYAHWLPYSLCLTIPVNVKVVIFQNFFTRPYRNMRGDHLKKM